MEHHVILCGLGRVGWRILEYLQAARVPVTVIDTDCRPDDPRLGEAALVQGDCRARESLEKAGLAKARGVIIATSDDLVNLSTTLLVRHLHEDVRVVVRMFNQNLVPRLGSAVSNVYPLSTSALAAPLFALIARTGEAHGVFRLDDGHRQQIGDFSVAAQSTLIGKKLGAVVREFDDLPLAHRPAGQDWRFLQEVDEEAVLTPGDQVIVCGRPKNLSPLVIQGENESLPQLLMAGWIKRLGRMIRRSLAEIDTALKISTSVLLAVIAISVLVFRFSMEKDDFIDAFYRTISLIATGADMRGSEVEPGAWQKAYISFLRLFGLILVAGFTAIFTNYLVRANLGGALEVRRIPDGGHVIVCGLGNIGFRVVEELLTHGDKVVAIERARDNPYIPTARRLGAAVIVGDAVILEVLKQAHAATARAVVAATSSDLINLEIALLSRQLAETMRVVVRLTDPNLAQTIRREANIRLAFSVPELAAPAFVAALFGDQVRGLFLVEGRLLAAFDLLVHSQDAAFRERTIGELVREYHFLPLALRDGDGKVKTMASNARLEIGDKLTVILALDELQKLLRREHT